PMGNPHRAGQPWLRSTLCESLAGAAQRLLAHLLAREDRDLDTTVLLTAPLIVVRRDRLRLATADRTDPQRRNALLDQERPRRLRTTLRKRLVVRIRPDR